MSDLLRLPDAAKHADMSTRELLEMIDRGEIEAVKVDGVLQVRRADIEATRPA